MENNKTLSRTTENKIGNVTYIVTTHYAENGQETAEDKLLRLVTDRITTDLKTANPLFST